MTAVRMWLGRWLMITGVAVLPPGRPRQELTQLMWAWTMKVQAIVAAHEGRIT